MRRLGVVVVRSNSGDNAEQQQGRDNQASIRRRRRASVNDNGFDFTEGLAAVRLGQTWHYIDPAGRTRLSCPGCQAVKPFRNGRAQIVRNGRRAAIDPSGRILEN